MALLRAAEEYPVGPRHRTIDAGPHWPRCPFYFGLYGGSNMPGFLDSDPATGSFLESHGYRAADATLVLQRRLDTPVPAADVRFANLRRQYVTSDPMPASIGSWWRECVYGVLEPVEFRLTDKLSGMPAARAVLWEMEGYSWRWGHPSAGVLDISGPVRTPPLRGWRSSS